MHGVGTSEHTKFYVNNAFCRYETQSLDSTLASYKRKASANGQWYVFVIDENDLAFGHPDAHRLGLDLKDRDGSDATGHNFG